MDVSVTATPQRVRISFRISNSGNPLQDQRLIIVPAETVATFLGEAQERLDSNILEEFGQTHLTRIIRRALELEASKKVIPNLPINAPRGCGLSDVLFVWPGQL